MLESLKQRIVTELKRRYARQRNARPAAAEPDPSVLAQLRLGQKAHRAGRLPAAAAAYRQALALAPGHALASNNLGMVEMEGGDLAAAILHFRHALGARPDSNKFRYNLAYALHADAQVAEAIDLYRAVLRGEPAHRNARSMLGMLLLASGDYSAASWDHYAAHRLQEIEHDAAFPFAPWDGSDLQGRSILLYGHQGIGDEINFASCVPDLVRLGARITLACSARLAGLFGAGFPGVEVRALETDATALRGAHFDFQCPLGRLGRFLRLRAADFGSGAAYLRADPARVQHWRHELERLGAGPWIGISWRGGNPRGSGAFRSVPLQEWQPVLSLPGAHWISLQYGECSDDIRGAEQSFGVKIHHWPAAIDDFRETAALLLALDDVVSVTTTLVHLAGAIGKETRVLVNARPHWRWGLTGERMPWYSSLRIYRQPGLGQWAPTLERVGAELRDRHGREPRRA